MNAFRQASDPARLEPPRYVPIRCRVCDRCWLDTERHCCIYSGPYGGYAVARTGEAA